LRECASVLTNMLSLLPSSHCHASKDSIDGKATPGISDLSQAGLETLDLESAMTH